MVLPSVMVRNTEHLTPPSKQSQTSVDPFSLPFNKLSRPIRQFHPRPCYPGDRGGQMATPAQAPATPTSTDPVQRWLQRRAAINRANSQHSTGPRTEPGKQHSSLNALRHGLTAHTAVLPTEDPEAYQRHIQQFLDEYAPATPTETQLVHEIANTAWRLNRIPFLEAELFSQSPNPQSLIPLLATLGLHGSRLSRQFQKALDQLREIQEAQRVRRAPPKEPGTCPRRTPFCASSSGRPPPPGAPPTHRSRRNLPTPSAQRTSLGTRPRVFRTSWLRFFKRTNRAPRATPDASQPHLLRQPPQFPGSPAAPRSHGRIAEVSRCTRVRAAECAPYPPASACPLRSPQGKSGPTGRFFCFLVTQEPDIRQYVRDQCERLHRRWPSYRIQLQEKRA
jgi:hypothetical protein